MNNDKLLKRAKKHVKKKKDFFTHAAVMVVTSLFLCLIAIAQNHTDFTWLMIATGAMALSVALHYIGSFGLGGLGKGLEDWEADELETEYLRLKEIEDRKKLLLDEKELQLRQLENRSKDDFV